MKCHCKEIMGTGLHRRDRRSDRCDVAPDLRPARGGQHQDGDPASAQVLLGREEQLERGAFGSDKQVAIAETRPTSFVCRFDQVRGQFGPQRYRCPLIEEDAHEGMRPNLSDSQTSLGMSQHGEYFLASHPGETT